MMSLRRAVAIGLMLAGIIHVVAVLAIPAAAPRNAYQRALALAMPGRVVVPSDPAFLPDLDPAFVHALCLLEPGEGAVRLAGRMPDTVWSLAVIDATGSTTWSASRAAIAGADLELDVGAATLLDRLRVERAAVERSTLYAPVETATAVVLIRAFAETPAERTVIVPMLQALACGGSAT